MSFNTSLDEMNHATFTFYSYLKATKEGSDNLQYILRDYGRSRYLAFKLRKLAQVEAKEYVGHLSLEQIDFEAIARRFQLEVEYNTPTAREVARDWNDSLVTIG